MAVEDFGGKVLGKPIDVIAADHQSKADIGAVSGAVRHPLNNPDFSSYLLQAQASGAKVVALANAGGVMTNATKQANDFGLSRAGYLSSSRTSIASASRSHRAFNLLPHFTGTVMTKVALGRNASSPSINVCRLRPMPPSTPPRATICAPSRPLAWTKQKR